MILGDASEGETKFNGRADDLSLLVSCTVLGQSRHNKYALTGNIRPRKVFIHPPRISGEDQNSSFMFLPLFFQMTLQTMPAVP